MITVNMKKAVEVRKQQLRVERKVAFNDVDVAMQVACLTKDDTQAAIVLAERQRLLDITDDPRLAAAKTPEQLLAVEL